MTSAHQTALRKAGRRSFSSSAVTCGRGEKTPGVLRAAPVARSFWTSRGEFAFIEIASSIARQLLLYIVTSSITPGSRQFRGCPISGNSQQSINAHQTIKKTLLFFTPLHAHTHSATSNLGLKLCSQMEGCGVCLACSWP